VLLAQVGNVPSALEKDMKVELLTRLIQVGLLVGVAWLVYALWISRPISARVCPSCNDFLGNFDAVHCAECLEFGDLFGANHKASKFRGGK
jgi:hypothetical protein